MVDSALEIGLQLGALQLPVSRMECMMTDRPPYSHPELFLSLTHCNLLVMCELCRSY